MATKNPLNELPGLGQSIWLDDIHRGMLNNGDFQNYIDNDSITGVTSNPAILKKAILDHDNYDTAIKQLAKEGSDARNAYEVLVISDLQQAADLLLPVYQKSNGQDGFVSMEVSPHYAHDTEKTITAGRRLWKMLDRPNVMIKVPATVEGLPAITALIADGINVNATLLFSVSRYEEIVQAFITGLQQRASAGLPINAIASVASFFLSRIDVLVDKKLIEANTDKNSNSELRGKAAISASRMAYQRYKALFSSEAWEALASKGASAQRLLWASTSTKNPAYPNTLYVEALIGENTVNTLPVKTLVAYRDHGKPAVRIEDDLEQSMSVLKKLETLGIDMEAVAQQLEDEGLEKFVKPFDVLLETLASKLKRA